VAALFGWAANAVAALPGRAEPPTASPKRCDAPPYMQNRDEPGRHYHPSVTVLIYKRDPDRSKTVHYPQRTLRPDVGLGISHGPTGSANGIRGRDAYRDIHAHDGSGRLHVEAKPSGYYTFCDLVGLWSRSPAFRKVWRNTAGGGAIHLWIDGYHIRRISLEKLLRIPLNHDMTITICIEQSVPV
jgi:hypothetical protein